MRHTKKEIVRIRFGKMGYDVFYLAPRMTAVARAPVRRNEVKCCTIGQIKFLKLQKVLPTPCNKEKSKQTKNDEAQILLNVFVLCLQSNYYTRSDTIGRSQINRRRLTHIWM